MKWRRCEWLTALSLILFLCITRYRTQTDTPRICLCLDRNRARAATQTYFKSWRHSPPLQTTPLRGCWLKGHRASMTSCSAGTGRCVEQSPYFESILAVFRRPKTTENWPKFDLGGAWSGVSWVGSKGPLWLGRKVTNVASIEKERQTRAKSCQPTTVLRSTFKEAHQIKVLLLSIPLLLLFD